MSAAGGCLCTDAERTRVQPQFNLGQHKFSDKQITDNQKGENITIQFLRVLVNLYCRSPGGRNMAS